MENTPHSSYTAVEDAFRCILQTLTNAQDYIQNKWETCKKKRANLETKMNEYNLAVNQHKRVSLCVGGMNFDTTEETLLKEKETFFWAMLRSGQWQPDDTDGRYFIDRSPNKFSVILDYLRDGEVWKWDRLSVDETNKLRDEFDFYQVPFPEKMMPLLRWDPTMEATLSLDNTSTILSVTHAANANRRATSTFPTGHTHVTFLLRTTRPKRASLCFGTVGIGLVSGEYYCDGHWKSCMPLLLGGELAVHEFKFDVALAGDSSSFSVTWPTGDKKTLQLPTQPTRLELLISKDVNCGVYELKGKI